MVAKSLDRINDQPVMRLRRQLIVRVRTGCRLTRQPQQLRQLSDQRIIYAVRKLCRYIQTITVGGGYRSTRNFTAGTNMHTTRFLFIDPHV